MIDNADDPNGNEVEMKGPAELVRPPTCALRGNRFATL